MGAGRTGFAVLQPPKSPQMEDFGFGFLLLNAPVENQKMKNLHREPQRYTKLSFIK